MLRRANQRGSRQRSASALELAAEVEQLRRKVARLEAALHEAESAGRQPVIEVRQNLDSAHTAQTGRAGFATAWSNAATEPDALDAFFTAGDPDLRARRWLLAAG